VSQEDIANWRCYKALSGDLVIATIGKGSFIVQVTYEGLDPNHVETVLKLVSEAYLAYSLESRQADIQRGISFVENRLPDLRDRVAMLQDQLQRLRQQYNLIDPDSRGAELSSQVNAFTQQQLESQVNIQQAQSRSADLQRQLAQSTELAASSALSDNPRYQSLISRLLQLDGEIAQASTLYLDAAPEMQVLQEQRRNLLSLLSREGNVAERQVSGDLQQLQVRDEALKQTIGSLKSDVNELAVISRVYTDLTRELQIATQALNQFQSQRESLQIEAAQREIPWELLTPPTEPIPASASLPRNLILGGALGLLVGIGAALLIERMTDVVYTPDELKRLTGLPLLGSIPMNDSLQGAMGVTNFPASLERLDSVIQQSEGRSTSRNRDGDRAKPKDPDSFSEAFRSLYANIRLLNSDSPIRSLVIGSAQTAEGKSTTAIHLAMAAAAMTQRVLLVETDLRRPKLHEYLGLQQSGGLIDVISGDLSLKDAIQRSAFEPNMFVLTAGAIPPDSTRVLSSQRMQRLMEQFQNSFDLVIYDAPPLVDFADAYLIAARTNGIVLVTEVGKLRRSLLEQALERIKVAKTPILGVVVQKATS
jgi:capsular exopolysaccharide synthesis family protein